MYRRIEITTNLQLIFDIDDWALPISIVRYKDYLIKSTLYGFQFLFIKLLYRREFK